MQANTKIANLKLKVKSLSQPMEIPIRKREQKYLAKQTQRLEFNFPTPKRRLKTAIKSLSKKKRHSAAKSQGMTP